MSQRKTKLLRIFQKHSQKIGEKIRFKTAHITLWGKISLLWSIICFISLIFPWISITDTSFMHGEGSAPIASSFSSVLGGVWFFILWAICIIMFSIFSIQKKEKLRFVSMIQLSDQLSAFFWSILIFILAFHSFILISGLRFFSISINYQKWVILCITGAIIIFIWAYIMKKEYRKNIKWSYISNIESSPEKLIVTEQKNNMKFPF